MTGFRLSWRIDAFLSTLTLQNPNIELLTAGYGENPNFPDHDIRTGHLVNPEGYMIVEFPRDGTDSETSDNESFTQEEGNNQDSDKDMSDSENTPDLRGECRNSDENDHSGGRRTE